LILLRWRAGWPDRGGGGCRCRRVCARAGAMAAAPDGPG